MFKYFAGCQTLEEARALYHRLAMQHHPDHGGDTRTMQEINTEWARYQADFMRSSQRQRQADAHAEGRKSAADYHDLDDLAEVLRIKIEALLNISPEIVVELCGLWIWVTGDTKTHREAIKTVEGMRYAPDKKAWYFAAVPSFNRTRRTMDEIRSMHGSHQFSRPEKADETETRQTLHA